MNPTSGGGTTPVKYSTALESYQGDAPEVLDDVVRIAINHGASDIHLEPKIDRMRVRIRVDGELVEHRPIPLEIATQVVSRVKVLARMDISERRLPQDGQLTLDIGPQRTHIRASTFPCSQGEKLVLRLLFAQNVHSFERLGMSAHTQKRVRDIVTAPQGFLVTCGPTGSGKTSTLYALLQHLDTTRVNVVTLEDPIEVELDSITQGQANARIGFTFASGLRAILRQDPDVILVGEIRDAETAGIALQAALTGHLVMSTLHTSDAVETVVRLVDLGVESWIIANALTGVIAQRLVRVACTSCKATVKLEYDFWDGDEILMPAGTEVVRPRGCAQCLRTGYKGRTGIFEFLDVDDEIRELIKAKASARDYREILSRRKAQTLRRAGYERIVDGTTTVDDVLRVTT
ncbi:MAG: GspE/PulE family protein [Polyangiales bacterium]